MVRVEETITVPASLQQTFAYIAEFAHTADWDPGVRSSKKLTPGALKKGDRYAVEASFAGLPVPMTYEVTQLEAPHRVQLRGEGATSVALDDIRFEAVDDDHTRITWALELSLTGIASLTEPLSKPLVDRLASEAMRGIKEAFAQGKHLEPAQAQSDDPSLDPLWRGVAGAMDALVAPAFSAPGYRMRERTWDDPAIDVDLGGKRFIVTGANSGIGKATTEGLARRGARVVMACRSVDRAERARRDILHLIPDAHLHIERIDLGDLQSVEDFADRIIGGGPIDGIIHNAGMLLDEKTYSPQEIELTFAVHVVGPFLLTQKLLAADALATDARVIFVSSGGMYTQRLQPTKLERGAHSFDGTVAYAQAKRAQVLLARRWAERLRQTDIAVSSMHPGWVDTPGVEGSLPRFYSITKPWLRSPEQGADTIIWLAASPQAARAKGEFYLDRQARSEHIPGAKTQSSTEEIDALWDLCEDLSQRR